MSAPNVDLVLVLDASDSMRPCIDQLRRHLRELIKPMQGYVGKIRFGLVSLSASSADGAQVFKVNTLAGGTESLQPLYAGARGQYEFFTEDPDKMIRTLEQIEVTGDEHNLLALDIALDHPFGPSSTTKRIVAMFSDEPLEAGVDRASGVSRIQALIDKVHKRRVKLFCAMPYSDAAQRLSEANGSEVEAVDGGPGLSSVNFKALLTQMGKSISVSALQGGLADEAPAALFGQDRWQFGDFGWNGQDAR
ncbi:MAG TPA: VWA domain-containing protein [Rubrivivax sp.]|nr:VWA domain-containing protein [Rubrivivax sp.]